MLALLLLMLAADAPKKTAISLTDAEALAYMRKVVIALRATAALSDVREQAKVDMDQLRAAERQARDAMADHDTALKALRDSHNAQGCFLRIDSNAWDCPTEAKK